MKSVPAYFFIITGIALVSCDRVKERMEITETRPVSSRAAAPRTGVPSVKRFHDDAPQREEQAPQKSPLTWVTPDGWKETPPDPASAGMRWINLTFGPNGEGECYLSTIPGDAGGAKANVDRWRGQMGLGPLSDEEFSKLPKKEFLRRDGLFIKVDGDFKGVGATEAKKNFRMLGLLHEAPQFTIFVKMTGPKEIVEQNEAAFDQFIQSIGVER